LTENLNEPTYGVEVSEGNDTHYFLGEDEVLWDWVSAPIFVPFIDGLAEVPLPDGYVLREDEDGENRLVKGGPASGVTTTLLSAESAYDDKAHVLTCGMKAVSRREFNAAGLSDERILRTVAF
jgi:hypothetical protein